MNIRTSMMKIVDMGKIKDPITLILKFMMMILLILKMRKEEGNNVSSGDNSLFKNMRFPPNFSISMPVGKRHFRIKTYLLMRKYLRMLFIF